ncbi:PIN domain-containing protein [Paenibacillus gorillae]|uniref:PIN domain-containing protein n=1 Tax=Paenibacillus gorillae TaxID=1243662 RepID=UPI00138AB741|nr:PIN domain-containing protein [Paenibacillus gorillae]
MYVILDSNILLQDLELNNEQLKKLVWFMDLMGLKIAITQITLDECFGNFKINSNREINEVISAYKKSRNLYYNKDRKKSIQTIEEGLRSDANARHQLYQQNVREFIANHNIEIIDYPKVAHESIIQRIYDRQFPFKDESCKEKGYKDYLIIEAIKQWISERDVGNVIFVTNNVKDFVQTKGKNFLHKDYACEEITVFSNINEVFDEHIDKITFQREGSDLGFDGQLYSTKLLNYIRNTEVAQWELLTDSFLSDISYDKINLMKVERLKISESSEVFFIEGSFKFELSIEIQLDGFTLNLLNQLRGKVNQILEEKGITFSDDFWLENEHSLKMKINVTASTQHLVNKEEDFKSDWFYNMEKGFISIYNTKVLE